MSAVTNGTPMVLRTDARAASGACALDTTGTTYTAQWVVVACANCGRQHRMIATIGITTEVLCGCGAPITVRGAR